MENEKMILFSDYVEHKKELANDIDNLLIKFLAKYPVELQELALNFRPGFGDVPDKFDYIEIVVK